jgi:hypothetical protein
MPAGTYFFLGVDLAGEPAAPALFRYELFEVHSLNATRQCVTTNFLVRDAAGVCIFRK